MTKDSLAQIVEAIIPQLYLCDNSSDIDWGSTVELQLDDQIYYYITYPGGGRGGDVGKIIKYIEETGKEFCDLDLHSVEIERSYVERNIATKWLEIRTKIAQSDWQIILDHIGKLQKRSYENLPVVKNLIIDSKKVGGVELTDQSQAKLFDMMGATNYVCFITDKDLRVIDYRSIEWKETDDKQDYSSIPNFLQPFTSVLDEEKVGISLTHSGDIIIYNLKGMILSIRKGNITVYENSFVKNLYRDVIKTATYNVACNLFDICWDLSYRRHGALIIVVKGQEYENHIVNKESILGNKEAIGIRKELSDSLRRVSLKTRGLIGERSMFLELSSIDGAIVIDGSDGGVKAFGSIIETASTIKNTSGARTTAAKSSIRYENMVPIKISSDGDITLYIKVKNKETSEDIILEYNFY
jgi:hypothetical protein